MVNGSRTPDFAEMGQDDFQPQSPAQGGLRRTQACGISTCRRWPSMARRTEPGLEIAGLLPVPLL
ncbi:hypothetical protein [Streptomyces sp. NBC_00162]|uniref:hypothetical protein n=1 Tax=Streptomyces sp. NBC_00162 TaxID=2903629 RepID=UPI00214BE92B|nr:hypothetical protein [Streptomyces sp. NBC_00162]UUU44135.1 hypothetical protein JIW86_38370 [Streptomyces sp. NBC_00162]